MAYFFTSIDSYDLGEKVYTAHFFSLFYGKMIVVICSMLAVAIKDLAMRWNNMELAVTGKSAVQFELAIQRKQLAYKPLYLFALKKTNWALTQ